MTNSSDGDRICSCHLCRSNNSFSMPQEIIESTIKNELVIFAGAGVSTESSIAFQSTFYQDIKDELGITEDNNISFSDLMSLYCKIPDGKRKLFQKLWYRFNYAKSFQEVYNFSTRFHRELSTIHHIKEIITTNWDDYFEEECGAIPIVNSKDFVFWDLPNRKVFKLHGCIRNFSSLVITKEDYEDCSKELNSGQLKGSYLKMLLATKKVVFVGYSFGDEDFNQLYNILNSEMNGLFPHSYIITLDSDIENKLPSKKITPIITDATYFISELKKHMVETGLMLSDIIFEKIPELLDYTLSIHFAISEKVNLRDYPILLYALSYQDGMIHAYQRIIKMKNTGEYSCPGCLQQLANNYKQIRSEKVRNKNYYDVSYIDGYIDGLYSLLIDEEQLSEITPYYVYGYKYIIDNFNEFIDILNSKEIFHQAAFKKATKIVKGLDPGAVPHHTPFL